MSGTSNSSGMSQSHDSSTEMLYTQGVTSAMAEYLLNVSVFISSMIARSSSGVYEITQECMTNVYVLLFDRLGGRSFDHNGHGLLRHA